MIIRQLNNHQFQVLDDPKLTGIYNCMQELQLWQGECPMDAEAGVDYFAIFENRKFIELEISRVIDKYKNSFQKYYIESINYDTPTLKVSIIFNINAELAYKFNLHINKDQVNG